MKVLCQLFTNYCALSSDQSCQPVVWEVRFRYKFQSQSPKNLKIEQLRMYGLNYGSNVSLQAPRTKSVTLN